MITVSAAYKAACVNPVASYGVRVELHQRSGSSWTRRATIYPDTWTVDIASGAARQLDLTLPSFDNLVPDETTTGYNRRYDTSTYGAGRYGDMKRAILRGLLLVAATRVKVWHRITVDGGRTWHECPLGTFDLSSEDFSLALASDETLTLRAYDARRALDLAGWLAPYKVPAGNAWTRAIQLALSIRPDLSYVSAATLGFTAQTARRWYGIGTEDASPWEVIRSLARRGGYEPFIDANGRLTATKIASTGAVAHTFTDENGGTVFTASRGHNDDTLINAVAVVGDSTKTGVIYATAELVTAGDPFLASNIGRRALTLNEGGLTNTGDAQNLADATLRRERGLMEQAVLEAVTLPFLEEFDAAGVDLPELEVDETFTIEGFAVSSAQDPSTRYDLSRRLTT